MDVRFLKEISEAYIIDTDINNVTADEVFEDLFEIIKILREYDLELYNQLYETTKLHQQQIFKTYLDNLYGCSVIQEGGLEPVSMLVGICMLLFNKPVIKSVYTAMNKVGKFFEFMTGWLNKQGKYMQLRYAMIYKNTKRCYTKCGITTGKDIQRTAFLEKFKTRQGQCLRECYLDEITDVIALGMENYFACLKRTTGMDTVRNASSDDILSIISRTNLSASCENFYSVAKEALDQFNLALDFMYDPHLEADKRLEKINELRNKIYKTKQSIVSIDQKQLQRYDNTVNLQNSSRRSNNYVQEKYGDKNRNR
ncbi:MAG: hypothetical protein PHD05_00770 [Sphaerochaetaceae bacterium]|jgi:hypothetical protein|nr:hypothetical protein [Sphaerochaetaceae bacterium]